LVEDEREELREGDREEDRVDGRVRVDARGEDEAIPAGYLAEHGQSWRWPLSDPACRKVARFCPSC
jgi:hypothetical protein